MAFTNENANGMVMPVSPIGNGGYGMGDFGGSGWWILVLFILLGGWGNGAGGYNGGAGLYPWMNQADQISTGFQNQMLNDNIGAIRSGIDGLTAQLNANQMANMNQTFGFQTAMLQGFNGIQSQFADCCCENRLAACQTQNLVQSEGAQTRLAIQNQTQAILDKMCQQELDAYKRENENLRSMVNMQALAASQTAQTAQLVADNTAQTQYIVNRVAPYPIPAYIVTNPVTPTTPATAG